VVAFEKPAESQLMTILEKAIDVIPSLSPSSASTAFIVDGMAIQAINSGTAAAFG